MSDVRHERLEELRKSTSLNGIDFVEIADPSQLKLRVRFLNSVPVQGTLTGPRPVTITGGAAVGVTLGPWSNDSHGRPALDLTVSAPGDYSTYTLHIASTALDRFFDHAAFSFKALCESTLDCEPPPHVCPPPQGEIPAIDYLAKDFLSFRKALSDFSSQRYPEWRERSEADFGMMFMEALCKVADDLSDLQDRIGWEATLETAKHRRSIVRHARLVDYEPRPALAARVLLQFEVPAGVTEIGRGIIVSAAAPDGSVIEFETGTSIRDTTKYPVSTKWNRSVLQPYYWDDSERCLSKGATEMWISGHGHDLAAGTPLLIETAAFLDADPPLREVVHVLTSEEAHDPIFNADVTRITWADGEALRLDHDIRTRTSIAGNLVPATQGRTYEDFFAIDQAPVSAPNTPLAIVRLGPPGGDAAPRYLWTLRAAPLAFLIENDAALPEAALTEWSSTLEPWLWRPRVIDMAPSERAFALEPFRMRRLATLPDGSSFHDYDGDDGYTIRFGDGTFGGVPDAGTSFRVTYRAGGGIRGNVAADSVTRVDPSSPIAGLLVSNPFAAEGGSDEEPVERIRRLAPHAFRGKLLRAVRPEDYSRAAETLQWVSRGRSVLRWTGSWLTMFTAVDPRAATAATIDQRVELAETLDWYRMAGREVYSPAAVYAALDVFVIVCANPDAFRGDVEVAVREALSPLSPSGFFHADHFTFGTPLDRSRLEASVQSARGVSGVVSLRVRRRGVHLRPIELPPVLSAGQYEIFRMDADPSHPEHGSLRIEVRGGR
jgi:hypothetical protein